MSLNSVSFHRPWPLFPKWRRIKLLFLSPVVLPPLPGEDGEIYDDVVDPNLEVRWVFPGQKPSHH